MNFRNENHDKLYLEVPDRLRYFKTSVLENLKIKKGWGPGRG